MNFNRVLLFAIFFIFAGTCLFSQNPPPEEQTKFFREVSDQIRGEIQNLKRPENQAIALVRIGNVLWETDKNEAEKLFSESIDKLIAAQEEITAQPDDRGVYQYLLFGQSPRVSILNIIAGRDADLAFDLLLKSRPAKLKELMEEFDSEASSPQTNSNVHFARSEKQLMSRLKILAARQNPPEGIENWRESLKYNQSYEALQFLNELFVKDPEKANKLAEELVAKVLKSEFDKNNGQNFGILLNYLTAFGSSPNPQKPTLQISGESLRALVSKTADYWLSMKNSYIFSNQAIEILKKFDPEKAKRIEKLNSIRNSQNPDYQEYTKLMAENPSVEKMIETAEKNPTYRNVIYSNAARKQLEAGNLKEAFYLIENNLPEMEQKVLLSGFYQTLAVREMQNKNYDQALYYIDQIPQKDYKINSLIQLANQISNGKSKEDLKSAEAILNQALQQVRNPAENLSDINFIGAISQSFVQINPEKSFELIESLIPQFNEYSLATLTLSKFRNDTQLRNGEYLLDYAGNLLGYFNWSQSIGGLAQKDPERTLRFIESLQLPELKLRLKIDLLDNASTKPILISNSFGIGIGRGKSFQ